MFPVRIGRVCPDLYTVFPRQDGCLPHGISIPGMTAAGNIAGGDMWKEVSLVPNPLPYVAIQINSVRFQFQLLRILKILQIPKPVTRISTREVITF